MAKIFGFTIYRNKKTPSKKINTDIKQTKKMYADTELALIERFEMLCNTDMCAPGDIPANDVKDELEFIYEKPLAEIKPDFGNTIMVRTPSIKFTPTDMAYIKSRTSQWAYFVIVNDASFYNYAPWEFQKHLAKFNETMSPEVLDVYARAYNKFLQKQATYEILTQKIMGSR